MSLLPHAHIYIMLETGKSWMSSYNNKFSLFMRGIKSESFVKFKFKQKASIGVWVYLFAIYSTWIRSSISDIISSHVKKNAQTVL